jgi:hypothetical protein
MRHAVGLRHLADARRSESDHKRHGPKPPQGPLTEPEIRESIEGARYLFERIEAGLKGTEDA